jgi:hypothetical protein
MGAARNGLPSGAVGNEIGVAPQGRQIRRRDAIEEFQRNTAGKHASPFERFDE